MPESQTSHVRTRSRISSALAGLALAGLVTASLVGGTAAHADDAPTSPATPPATGTPTDTASPPTDTLAIVVSSAPVITGTATVGKVLSVTQGVYTPAAPTLTVTDQWERAGQPIEGATALTYTLTAADQGKTITVVETAAGNGYSPAVSTTAAEAPIAMGTLPTPTTPVLAGAARIGQLLRASTSSGPGNLPSGATIAWSWTRSGVAIPAATSASYPLTNADRGKTLAAAATFSAPGYSSARSRPSLASSAVTGPIGITLSSSITGTTTVGNTLTAHLSAIAAGTTYQWQRGGVPIAHATGTTYHLVAADAGHSIRVAITVRPAFTDPATFVSPSTATVIAVFSTRPAVIVGTRQVGHQLAAVFPTWTPAATGHGYRWLRNGKAISGATSSRYTLTGADAGSTIGVTITGWRSGYKTVALTTNAAGRIASGPAPRATKAPLLRGTTRSGSRLVVTAGSWNTPGLTAHYTWYRSGVQVPHATSSSYTLSAYDLGKRVNARVTVTRTGYANGTALSNSTGAIAQALPAITGDGMYAVGRSIAPGTYWSAGGGSCYWERLSSADGSFDSIIANDLGEGPRMITIRSGDRWVHFQDCGRWYPISAAGPAQTSMSTDGVYKVGQQIVSGTYRARSSSCYWERDSSADGELSSIITNDYASGSVYVTISPSDFSFQTSGCGRWTKVG